MRPTWKTLANGLRIFVNRGRSSLFRLIATALAIILVVFALTAWLGGMARAAQPPVFAGKLLGEIAERMSVTLEPVLISFFVASALGFVLTLSTAPILRVAVTIIVTGLQSLPIFAFAIFLLFVSVSLPLPLVFCAVPCTFNRHLASLALPLIVLTTYQLPLLVNFFDRRTGHGHAARVDELSTVRGLAILFADRLPSLISAAMVGEIIYGWRGEGRWLGIPDPIFFHERDASVFVLFLIFNAMVVLLIRCIIELLVQRPTIVTDAPG